MARRLLSSLPRRVWLGLQDLSLPPLGQLPAFLESKDMGDAVENLLLVIGYIKKVCFRLTDHLNDVQNPSPVQNVEAVTGFVQDEKRRGLDHGPGQEDHSF